MKANRISGVSERSKEESRGGGGWSEINTGFLKDLEGGRKALIQNITFCSRNVGKLRKKTLGYVLWLDYKPEAHININAEEKEKGHKDALLKHAKPIK